MNTGMTRGYKKEVIKNMKFDEKGKEFHLEALLKLFSIGAHIVEVPLFWNGRMKNYQSQDWQKKIKLQN